MVAEPIVKHVGDRPNEDVEDELKEANEWGEVVPDWNFMLARAVSLRKHLPEDHNCNSRDNDGKVTRHDLVQEDRKGLECEWIWKQQSGKQQMMVIENIKNGSCHLALVLVIRVHPDLHLCLADRHEAHS